MIVSESSSHYICRSWRAFDYCSFQTSWRWSFREHRVLSTSLCSRLANTALLLPPFTPCWSRPYHWGHTSNQITLRGEDGRDIWSTSAGEAGGAADPPCTITSTQGGGKGGRKKNWPQLMSAHNHYNTGRVGVSEGCCAVQEYKTFSVKTLDQVFFIGIKMFCRRWGGGCFCVKFELKLLVDFANFLNCSEVI